LYSPLPQVYDPTDPQYPYKPPVIRRVRGTDHPNDGTGGLFRVIHAAGDQGNQLGRHGLGSLMSAAMMASPTTPSPSGMLGRQMDAMFLEFDAVALSLASNLTAMNSQRSRWLGLLNSNLDALEATVLDRLDALETASSGTM
jgi:hypothetical protein